MNSKIIFMPHANIQYSQLAPQRRHWVMKNCYEKLFDLVASDDYKIAFEASGITIEEMAKQAPEVLAKLKALVAEGKIEPVSSPYIHFMLSNIPKEVCLHSLKHSLDVWEQYVGERPKSAGIRSAAGPATFPTFTRKPGWRRWSWTRIL